jgi:tetratricopeptide (TPR) repeat protein
VPAGAVLIMVVVFICYLPCISGGFIWDDNSLMAENLTVKAVDGLYRFWCTTEPQDYWPVTNTSFWLEWRLWGIRSTGYHVTNLILHIVTALLIWVILRKLCMPGAFLAGLIFAVHPVNVESVGWIAERKNLLALLFFLVSILCYLEFLKRARRPCEAWRPLAAKQTLPASHYPAPTFSSFIPHPSSFHLWYCLSLLIFVLAMLSKGSVAVLPVILLGIVWWLRPLTGRDVVRSVPFFAIAAILAGVNVWFQSHGTDLMIRTATFTQRVLGAGGVMWFYLYKALLPLNLLFVYPQWRIEAGNILWWLPLAAVVVVTVLLWRYRKGWSRPFLFAWGFFCAALLPVLGFTDVYFMKFSLVADHYQHIALIGVVVLAAAGLKVWRERVQGPARWAANAAAVVVAGILAVLTYAQSSLYSNELTLYQATLEKNPDSWMTQSNLANVLLQAGRVPEAIDHYQQALRLRADYFDAQNNLGFALSTLGRTQEAIEHYGEALRLRPDDPGVQNNLGIAIFRTGRIQEAIEHFKKALEFKPDHINACYNLAMAYARLRQSAEAMAMAQKAIEIAKSQGQTEQAKQIENWLNTYRSKLSGFPKSSPNTNSQSP